MPKPKKTDDPIHTRMRKYVNRHMSNLFKRAVYILLFATIQVAFLAVCFIYLENLTPYFWVLCILVSLLAAAHIINKNNNPAYKIAWLIPILLMPIFGGLLYLMFGSRRVDKRLTSITDCVRAKYTEFPAAPTVEDEISVTAPRDAVLQSSYITMASGCRPYTNTQTRYYPSGEEMFYEFCEALRLAEQYIFLEFFIIEEGVFWDTVLDILTEKAKAGVDVRVMYDDFGSMLTLPMYYEKTLRDRGIKAHVFNPFNTVLSPRPNNRDHRKIAVVDGKIAFVGGINLADEYINTYEKHGYWKDTAIRLSGDAAWGCAIQFLCVWDADTRETTDFALFAPQTAPAAPIDHSAFANGIVQPYTDIPMDNEQVGETVYFQLITRAEKYIYITTPYLIIDYELLVALQTAAKSGVDVRIITPHIPDKKTVFFLTRSYYKPLMDAGVKIYEFTPGFIHAKSMVADDRFAVVGSINLDYRSLYLHLENAVWMYGTDAIPAIRDDFLATQEKSERVTDALLGKLTFLKRMWLSILRTFAPLL
ncbi:MAG: cardiolipin synthase [Clostridia bacterium]|nr:cardiolipin synthase [Clostridia bacterium]